MIYLITMLFSLVYWGVVLLVSLIPVALIILLGGYIFYKLLSTLIYLFW